MVRGLNKIKLASSPAEVAVRLRHLGGLVYFDSSGNFPESCGEVYSIVAAAPATILRGNLANALDLESLQQAQGQEMMGDEAMPTGGLCGWVGYEGDFVFGDYRRMLVYRHSDEQWFSCGELEGEMRDDWGVGERLKVSEFHGGMGSAEYMEKVRRIQNYIAAGDIYQVNLTQKFEAEVSGSGDLWSLYEHLRQVAPAPLAAYMSLAGVEVLSTSPETFLKMNDRRVETRPIKGTRPRFDDPELDLRSADELQSSEKERAELVMITDLERNDLGLVCEFGSVRVDEMLKLEKLEHVYHLVSTVSGKLRTGLGQVHALKACFPGGSITGAPKKRAMEIIAELEDDPRGIYTGCMGYFGHNGVSQFNIVIRTLVREGQKLHYHVGAGIVADSDPAAEFEETLQKAKGLRLALEGF